MSTEAAAPTTRNRPLHARATRRSSKAWLIWPVATLAVTRLAALAVIVLATHRRSGVDLKAAMSTWDGSWYLRAAQHGWPSHVPMVAGHVTQSTIAFFPGLPLAIRAVAWIPGISFFAAAMIVEVAFQISTVVLVWVLAADLWGDEAARRAVVVLCVFPGAFIFSLIYSEPLLFTCALGCLLALRKHRWLVAGIAAGLGTAVTPTGVALVACCALASAVAIGRRREWRSVIAPVLAPAGIVGYLLYLTASTGDLHAWTATERQGWGEQIVPSTFLQTLRIAVHHHGQIDLLVTIAGTGVAVVLVGLMLLSRPSHFDDLSEWWAQMLLWSLVVLGLAFVSNILGLRPRFVLTAFPLLMVLGWRLKGVAFALLSAGSFAGLVWLLWTTVTSLRLVP